MKKITPWMRVKSEKRKERKPIIQLVILQTQGQFCATALAGANAFTVFWLP